MVRRARKLDATLGITDSAAATEAAAVADARFRTTLAAMGASNSDDALADAVAAEGLRRARTRTPLDLSLFLDAIGDLAVRPVVLDAAIEATLHSLRSEGMTPHEAVEFLAESYPTFKEQIRLAGMLGDAMVGTSEVAARLHDNHPLPLPTPLGPAMPDGRARYELQELLAGGSQGLVYLAIDRALSEPNHPAWVAVKVLADREAPNAAASDEATRARRVIHTNVVRVLDRTALPDGRACIVYELIRAGDLDAWRKSRQGPVPQRDAARLIAAAARGVQAAHSQGLTHRDIKPGNILIADGAVPKVADFGLAETARHTAPTHRRGNLAFLSPEQFRCEPAASTPSTDIYALGGLLFWLLTDRYPNGQSPEEVGKRLGTAPGAPAVDPRTLRTDIDSTLALICLRALAPDPALRYASADALANDLDSYLRHEVIAWTKPGIAARAGLFFRRSPLMASSLAAAACLIVTGTAWSAWTIADARSAEREASLQLEIKDQQQRAIEERLKYADVIQNALMKYLSEGPRSVGGQWIGMLTFVEAAFGPHLFESTSQVDISLLFDKRIEAAQAMIDAAEAEGRGDDVEPLMWHALLGLWQMTDGRHADAHATLKESRERWIRKTSAGDQWITQLDLMIACAHALRLRDEKAPKEQIDAAIARIDELDAKLGPMVPTAVRRTIPRAKGITPTPAPAQNPNSPKPFINAPGVR